MLRLAGARIIPRTRRPQNANYWSDFTLVALPGGSERPIHLPPNLKLGFPAWNANGHHFAFTVFGSDSVELWLGNAASAQARKTPGVRLNPFLGNPFQWMPVQKTLLVRAVPEAQGASPQPDAAPRGPSIQETSGAKGPSGTYEVRDVDQNDRASTRSIRSIGSPEASTRSRRHGDTGRLFFSCVTQINPLPLRVFALWVGPSQSCWQLR